MPIAIDGMVIEPGDLMMGDGDGVLCVPRAHAEEIYKIAHARNVAELKQLAAIAEGREDRSWVDALLETKGLRTISDQDLRD